MNYLMNLLSTVIFPQKMAVESMKIFLLFQVKHLMVSFFSLFLLSELDRKSMHQDHNAKRQLVKGDMLFKGHIPSYIAHI